MNAKLSYVLLVLLLLGCRDNTTVITESTDKVSIDVKVLQSAGKSWTSDGSYFMPSPFNVCTYKDLSVLVLNNAISEGKNIMVTPIGALKIKEGGVVNHYILAIDESKTDVPYRNFDDLVTEYSSVKWMIEQYMLSRNGMGHATLVSWENQDFVMNKLLNNNI